MVWCLLRHTPNHLSPSNSPSPQSGEGEGRSNALFLQSLLCFPQDEAGEAMSSPRDRRTHSATEVVPEADPRQRRAGASGGQSRPSQQMHHLRVPLPWVTGIASSREYARLAMTASKPLNGVEKRHA